MSWINLKQMVNRNKQRIIETIEGKIDNFFCFSYQIVVLSFDNFFSLHYELHILLKHSFCTLGPIFTCVSLNSVVHSKF